ncbi:MAG TPA: bifunctional phosphoglucose/phosphomannose isomerase [Thermoplasmata archaeon]|nr:bifunctional phosphoglucose/phosphomannose isomerase [Thermoplasmata archaeon]
MVLELETIARVDPGGMRDIIGSFPEQLADGIRRGLGMPSDLANATRVFIVGMGGSGIAGEVFAAWVANRSRIPIHPIHDYRLPSYAKPGDLVIAVSYSGNTEETLAATAQGIKLGCRLVAVTSGGALAKLAQEAGAPLVEVPAGLPPRGAFGHLFGILPSLGAEWVYGDLRGELERATVHLRDLRDHLRPQSPLKRNRAKLIATRLKGTTPIVYGAPPFDAIAKRWQTQLNENAKMLAFSSTLPEADHNEIIGWASDASARRFRAVILRDADETPEMHRRLDATAALFGRHAKVELVHDEDDQLLGRMLGTLFLGDFVSLYLAALRRVDPLPVEPIRELKERLKKTPHAKG